MSSVTGLVYLINRVTKNVIYAGEVPEVYDRITGLAHVEYAILQDLYATWAFDSVKDLGFFKEEDALRNGVASTAIAAKKAGAWALKWSSMDDLRSQLINDQRWRIDRYNDETMLGIPHREDIQPVLDYIQAIRNLPITNPDPYNIVWPTIPPLPSA